MSELSRELQDLVLACKAANLPTEGDSARVLAGLRACLGDAAVLGAKASQAAASTSSGLLVGKVSAVSLAGLALIGGIWFFTARNHQDASEGTNGASSVVAATSVEMISEPSSPVATPPAAVTAEANTATPNNDGANNVEPRPVASQRRSRDKLAEEVALLSRAETALHSGRPAAALEVLNEHERQFGNGILAEERTAARIQALCALGRKAEADAQLARLSPKSLHGGEPGKACGAGRNN